MVRRVRLLLVALSVVAMGAAGSPLSVAASQSAGGSMTAPAAAPESAATIDGTARLGAQVSANTGPQLGPGAPNPVKHDPAAAHSGQTKPMVLGHHQDSDLVPVPNNQGQTGQRTVVPTHSSALPNAGQASTVPVVSSGPSTAGPYAQVVLSGTVTDTSANPIQGIVITLCTVSPSYTNCQQGYSLPTDANGQYSVWVATGGTYQIGFWDPKAIYEPGWWTSAGFNPSSAGLIQVGSSDISGLDVSLPLLPLIKGTVTDTHGMPLSGIEVSLFDGLGLAGDVTTAPDGTYSFTSYPGNVYTAICFIDPNNVYSYGCYGGSSLVFLQSEAATFSVASSDKVIDVALPMLVQLSGIVNNQSGESSILICAVYHGSTDGCNYMAGDGSYALSVHPGVHTVYLTSGASLAVWYSASGPVYVSGAASPINVGDTNLTVNVTFPPIIRMSGKVTDNQHQPIANIEVDLFLNGYFVRSGQTAPDGSWSMLIPPGRYQIGYFDSTFTYASGWYANGSFSADPMAASIVNVGAVGASGLNVSLPISRFITGKVLKPSGTGLAYAFVEAWVDDIYYAGTYASSTGTYAIPVTSGRVTLWVFDNYGTYAGGWRSGTTVSANRASATVITVGSADVSGINVTLKTAGRIYVSLTWQGNGPPGGPPDAYAYAYGEAASFGMTDWNGYYVWLPVIAGSYTLWLSGVNDMSGGVFAGGWYTTQGWTADSALATPVIATAGTTKSITYQLPKGHMIMGSTKDRYRNLIDQIEVQVFFNGHFYDEIDPSLSSAYSIVVPNGTYKLGAYDLRDRYTAAWYGAAGIVSAYADATPIVVAGSDVGAIDFSLAIPGGPYPPTQVLATPHNQSALVSWKAPLFVNSGPITKYTVTSSPEGKTCTTTGALSCAVMNLTNGQPYTFTVVATNAIGSSDPSAPSAPVTPVPTPNAPTGVKAIGLNASAAISWSAAVDNGYAVTGYKATANPGNHVCTTTGARSCTIGGLTNHSSYTVTVTATNSKGVSLPSAAVSVIPRAGNSYVALTPSRVMNSKANLGITGAIAPSVPASFQVTNLVPADASRNVPVNATAVTGVLSVSASTCGGFVALMPAANNAPTTSTINFPTGDARSTGVTVPLGTGGKLWVTYVAPATTNGKRNSVQVIFDVTGYFAAGTGGAMYYSLTPNRILDSRPTGSGHTNTGLSGVFVTGVARTFQVTGRTPAVPSTNVPATAVAVTGTLTVTGQTAAGLLTLEPDALAAPPTASLYFPKGDNRATSLTVKLGAGGKLSVTFTSSTVGATTNVIFDVTGYFAPSASGAMYVPLTPNRLVDSRIKLGLTAAVPNRSARTFTVWNRVSADVTKNVPTGATAVTGTLTVTRQTYPGWLALTPTPNNNPPTSTLNFPKGDNRATGVTVPLSSLGKLSVTYGAIAGAYTHVVFDVSGYFVN